MRHAVRIAVATAVATGAALVPSATPAGARPIEPGGPTPVVTEGSECSSAEAGLVGKTVPGLRRLSGMFCGKAPGDPVHRWRALNSSTHPLVGAVDRLYQAFYDRVPDGEGFAYWLDLRVDGVPLDALGESFFAGREFGNRDRFPAIFVGDFIERVYAQVLGRQPGPDAFAYWFQLLNDLVITRARMITAIAQSPEFRAKTHTV